MPVLNALGVIEDFTLNLWGKYLCYGILAISIDLLWGYTGLLCLGQALFFTLGGYMMGMHLMLMIGKLGQYKSDLPDFMVFLGHSKTPRFLAAVLFVPVRAAMVFLVPGLLAWCSAFSHSARASRASISPSSPRRSPMARPCCSSATNCSWAATTASPISERCWVSTCASPPPSAASTSAPPSCSSPWSPAASGSPTRASA